MSVFFYLITLFGFILTAQAQAQAQFSLNTSSLHVDEPSQSSPAVREGHGEFGLKQSQYLNANLPEYRKDAGKTDSSVSLKLESSISKDSFTAKINGKDEYSAVENWNYGDVYEVYAGTKGKHAEFFAGRKLDIWSAWDEEWKQGAFQPRYMENRMRMDQAGLTGFFFGAGTDHFKATLAVLPVFVPDFGAHFYVQDDRFTSKNPWFHPPANHFDYLNGTGDIHYSLNHPENSDVIHHGGGALKFDYKDGGYQARLSGAYKPIPQFLLGFPSSGKFVQNDNEDHFDIQVNPRVAYDRIVNLDNIYISGPWAFSGSLAYSNPDDPGEPQDWTRQEIRPATIFSGSVERRLGEAGPHAASVKLGFLKINGGDAKDSGPFAGDKTLFERRYQFEEAYSLGVHKDFRVGLKNPFETEMRVIYDRMQGGGLVTFDAGTFLSRSFRADIEADIIGLLTSTAQVRDGFIDEFRANDRFSLGMSYVF